MKKHRLRGMLLGVSLALLLAGGVALAQGLTVTVDPDCFECWASGQDAPEGQYVVATLDGYGERDLCFEHDINGELYWDYCFDGSELAGPPCQISLAVICDDLHLMWGETCAVDATQAALLDARIANGPAEYGDWVLKVWEEENGERVGPLRQVAFTFAAVCAEEAEAFVPEPGTIALLGSGLAGLAGYAALRWRAHS